jgi:hypothetical protein
LADERFRYYDIDFFFSALSYSDFSTLLPLSRRQMLHYIDIAALAALPP